MRRQPAAAHVKPGALRALLVWQLAYVGCAWTQNAFTGFWPYPFMRLDTWAAIGWLLGIFVAHVLLYSLVALGSRLKGRCAPSLKARPFS